VGRFDEARGFYDQALAMCQALYPVKLYPNGHPEIVAILTRIASNYAEDANLQKAQEYAQRSMAMCRSLYPKERYPQEPVSWL